MNSEEAPPEKNESAGSGGGGRHGVMRLVEYLFEPVDAASLAVFRICFGLLVCLQVLKYFHAGWIYRYFVQPQFYFYYLPFIQPLPGIFVFWLFVLLGIASLCLAAGLWYRTSAVVTWLLISYFFLIDKTNYLNHMYLICLIAFLICLTPADNAFSLDRLRKGKTGRGCVPRWCLLLLKAQVTVVFFFAGLAKLNSDWMSGYPQAIWLKARAQWPVFGPIIAQDITTRLVTWGGIAVDLTVGFLLWFSRTYWLGLGVAVVFLTTNGYLFNIGVFPALMISALGLFAAPDWPRQLIKKKGPDVSTVDAVPVARRPFNCQPRHYAVLAFLGIYCAIQLFMPLRHFLYPGNCEWTEEGRRFAWRMMLREKSVVMEIFLTNPKTGRTELVNPLSTLTLRQVKMMGSVPDMLIQYAHFLADRYQAQEGVRPAVRMKVMASLNGRPSQLLIDPTVDLAAQKEGQVPAPWIKPLTDSELRATP